MLPVVPFPELVLPDVLPDDPVVPDELLLLPDPEVPELVPLDEPCERVPRVEDARFVDDEPVVSFPLVPDDLSLLDVPLDPVEPDVVPDPMLDELPWLEEPVYPDEPAPERFVAEPVRAALVDFPDLARLCDLCVRACFVRDVLDVVFDAVPDLLSVALDDVVDPVFPDVSSRIGAFDPAVV